MLGAGQEVGGVLGWAGSGAKVLELHIVHVCDNVMMKYDVV